MAAGQSRNRTARAWCRLGWGPQHLRWAPHSRGCEGARSIPAPLPDHDCLGGCSSPGAACPPDLHQQWCYIGTKFPTRLRKCGVLTGNSQLSRSLASLAKAKQREHLLPLQTWPAVREDNAELAPFSQRMMVQFGKGRGANKRGALEGSVTSGFNWQQFLSSI